MQETTHQIEAVHPQPPAHHPFPTSPPHQTIGYKTPQLQGTEDLTSDTQLEVLKGSVTRFGSRSGLFRCLMFGVLFPTAP